MAESCWYYDNNDWWGVWLFVFFFIFIIIILCSFTYYRQSDYCGEYLPPERYQYRPSRVIVKDD